MKYSFTLDVCLTAFIWGLLGWSLGGLFIAVVVGTIGSIKLATAWHRFGGLRAVCQAVWSGLIRLARRALTRRTA